MSVIQRIKELREKATQDKWEFQEVEEEGGLDIDYGIYSFAEDRLIMFNGIEDMALPPNDSEYIVALHNAFPSILQEHEALLRFVEAVKEPTEDLYSCNHKHQGEDWQNGKVFEEQVYYCADRFSTALQALDKELKG